MNSIALESIPPLPIVSVIVLLVFNLSPSKNKFLKTTTKPTIPQSKLVQLLYQILLVTCFYKFYSRLYYVLVPNIQNQFCQAILAHSCFTRLFILATFYKSPLSKIMILLFYQIAILIKWQFFHDDNNLLHMSIFQFISLDLTIVLQETILNYKKISNNKPKNDKRREKLKQAKIDKKRGKSLKEDGTNASNFCVGKIFRLVLNLLLFSNFMRFINFQKHPNAKDITDHFILSTIQLFGQTNLDNLSIFKNQIKNHANFSKFEHLFNQKINQISQLEKLKEYANTLKMSTNPEQIINKIKSNCSSLPNIEDDTKLLCLFQPDLNQNFDQFVIHDQYEFITKINQVNYGLFEKRTYQMLRNSTKNAEYAHDYYFNSFYPGNGENKVSSSQQKNDSTPILPSNDFKLDLYTTEIKAMDLFTEIISYDDKNVYGQQLIFPRLDLSYISFKHILLNDPIEQDLSEDYKYVYERTERYLMDLQENILPKIGHKEEFSKILHNTAGFLRGFCHFGLRNPVKARAEFFTKYSNSDNRNSKLLHKLWFDLEFMTWKNSIKSNFGTGPSKWKRPASEALRNCLDTIWPWPINNFDPENSSLKKEDKIARLVAEVTMASQENRPEEAEKFAQEIRKLSKDPQILQFACMAMDCKKADKLEKEMVRIENEKSKENEEKVDEEFDDFDLEQDYPKKPETEKEHKKMLNKVQLFFLMNEMKNEQKEVISTLDEIKEQNAEQVRIETLSYLQEFLDNL